MKNLRQAEILNIVQSVDIETQEQMLEELKARGISATQATISRDIKELRLVKVLTGKVRTATPLASGRALLLLTPGCAIFSKKGSSRWMWPRIS